MERRRTTKFGPITSDLSRHDCLEVSDMCDDEVK